MKTRVKINYEVYSTGGSAPMNLIGKTGYIDGYVYGFIDSYKHEKGALAVVVLDDSNNLVEIPIWKLSRLEEL